jgi:hypothetical protein
MSGAVRTKINFGDSPDYRQSFIVRILEICLVVSEITYADGWTGRQASRDEGRQTQHSAVLMHFVQITHKNMLIILCVFGFPCRREVDPC